MTVHYEYNGTSWVETNPVTHDDASAMVYGDIPDYTSMIDGSTITSRSRHRAHLKDHGCIEIGNEAMTSTPTPPSSAPRRALLRDQLAMMTSSQATLVWRQLLHESRRRKD